LGDTNHFIKSTHSKGVTIGTYGANEMNGTSPGIFLQEGGNVGIGTNDTFAKLTVWSQKENSNPFLLSRLGYTDNVHIDTDYQNEPRLDIWAAPGLINLRTNYSRSQGTDLAFGTRAREQAMIIKENGQVGIGTSTPTARLEIGPVGSEDGLQISNTGWHKAIKLNDTDVMVFDTGENRQKYFIGATSYNQVLYFATIQEDNTSVGATTAMTIDSSGGVDIPNLLSACDVRLKKNIVPCTSGLEVIREFQVKEFEYNGLNRTVTNQSFIGLIAQDVEKIAPFLVEKTLDSTVNDQTDLSGLLYLRSDRIKYLLINAIQELDQKIEKIAESILEQ